LRVYASTFNLPKRGSSLQEYEDAFWVGPDGDGNGEIEIGSLRVVVADGASASMLAGRWARRLVKIFGSAKGVTRTRPDFLAAYREAAYSWDEEVREYKTDREKRGVPIEWYEEPGLAKGAYATILVVEFSDGRSGYPPRWKAAAIGDSCLFQVRGESLSSCFPISDVAGFSYQPSLLPSRVVEDDVVFRHVCLKTGYWQPEDRFYIATDALAAWFLRSWQAEKRPWAILRDLDTEAGLDFATWVDQQRDLGEMHDDDTTLVRIDT
jgi:hypothetical protein